MKKLLKRYIKRKVFAIAFIDGKDVMNQYVRFITDAPIWQWRKRLWLAKKVIGLCKPSELDEWLRFLDE